MEANVPEAPGAVTAAGEPPGPALAPRRPAAPIPGAPASRFLPRPLRCGPAEDMPHAVFCPDTAGAPWSFVAGHEVHIFLFVRVPLEHEQRSGRRSAATDN
jgi:hypothetical protein